MRSAPVVRAGLMEARMIELAVRFHDQWEESVVSYATCLDARGERMFDGAQFEPRQFRLIMSADEADNAAAITNLARSDNLEHACWLCAELCMRYAALCEARGEEECAAECRRCAALCRMLAPSTTRH